MDSLDIQPKPPTPAAEEPRAARRTVPVWLLVLLLLLIYWGMLYFDEHGGWFSKEVYYPFNSFAEVLDYQPPKGGIDLVRGKKVFDDNCAVCHNTDGMGKPAQAPPLNGSEWVKLAPNRLLRIPLYGLNGPITVKGQQMTFTIPMVAIGQALPEEALAAALTYVRQVWGDKASPITVEQIKAVKTQVGNRSTPFTPEEVMQAPEK